MQVVVVDERDAAAELRIERALVDALQVMLADVVGGMRLAGEHDLHGPAGARSGSARAVPGRGRSAPAACSR